ncbi:MAG TPA: molybdopterin-dependent oxidoreductase [Desulfomonilaceae bacterium]|nr:molybdopterin-dependent oxidoreductase [Desulfomonilaceae bacterium]
MPVLTIDNTEVTAAEGATILEAAKSAGIWIPTLCYYPKTSPSDSCRMCVVEIEGVTRPMTSCNTVAADGMRIHTDTEKIREIREQVMKLILMDHPLDCPTCPAAGECEIQNLTYRLGIHGTDYKMERRGIPVVRDWRLIEYDANLCITCLRCVKVCHEVIGASALALTDVGYDARITTRDGRTLDCDFCGECVEACPSGAMSNKISRRWARSWELRKTATVCPLCSAGCRMEMNVKDGRIFRITTDMETHNKGTLCAGGRFGYDIVDSEERLVSPLIRKEGRLQPVSWEEALAFASGKLKQILRESGPDSIAGLASPRLTNEDCYAFQKFFRAVLGTNNIDSEARFSFLRVQRALELTSGVKGTSTTLDDLLQTEAMLVIGLDPSEETPALGWKIKAAARRYDSNVIIANCRKTSLDQFARVSLEIRPYSESDLVLGIMKLILDKDLWDTKFVRDHTSNFLPMKNLLDKISLKGILKRTGVTAEQLEDAARILGEAPSAAIIFGGDVILQENGLQCVMNLVNLAFLTGNVGRAGSGIYPIFEKGNMLGLCEMGALPEYLPGYQDAASARDLFRQVWKTDLPYTKGKTVPEMVRGLESGEVRALYVAGADPLTDYPHAGRFASALEKADFTIVQDLFMSPTAKMAHCVFPAASFAEKDGTMTNIEHRVQMLHQVIPPRGEAIPDWSIFEEMAKALGRPMGFFKTADVFREMALTLPFYKGIQLQDLAGDGRIIHPFTGRAERLRGGRPYSFAPVRTWEAPEHDAAAEYPFEMIAGRCMHHFGSTSTHSKNLLILCPEGRLEIHEQDAHALNLGEGLPVRVTSPGGSFVAPVKLSRKIRRGMVFIPTNFPELGVYRLFQENTTVCRVKLAAVQEERADQDSV